jgi:predicted acylesterase/phospholipase RssA
MKTESGTLARGPLADADPPIHILMALQGGGALGAFQVGILEHLHNGLGVGGQIRALSGVSVGAMNAAIYVSNYRKDPIRALKKFWNNAAFIDSPLYPRLTNFYKDTPFEPFARDLSVPAYFLSLILSPGFFRQRLDYWNFFNWTYLWLTEPLKKQFEQLIDLHELNSPENPQLIITTVNIESGDLEIFDNRKQRLTLEHILTSGSLPPAFSPTEINRRQYWDGSLFDNSPFITLLRSLEEEELLEPFTQDPDDPTDDPTIQQARRNATQKRLITVELFPREGAVPTTFADSANRVIELRDRVKVTKRSTGSVYEFGVLVNWLGRFFHNLAGTPGGSSSKASVDTFKNNVKQLLIRNEIIPDDADDTKVEGKLKEARQIVLQAAHDAMTDFFGYPRPGQFPIGYVNEDCSVDAKMQSRRDEIQLVGINPPSLAVINEFDRLLAHALVEDGNQTPEQHFQTLIAKLSRCKLLMNQVVRFSNIEFLPLKTSVRSGLLGSSDFSPSAIRKRYEAGLQLAQEQIVVAKFKDKNGKDVRDLKFVPPPNES